MNFDSKVLQIAIEDIIPNRFQPRLSFEDSSLQELASSIQQHGIIQPLVLRRNGEKYEIIAGERRYKAATMAGLASVPAVIANIDDKTSAEVAVAENVQRRDLTAIEEAKSYKALLDLGYMTQEQLARKMGVSPNAITNKLRLLSLHKSVQDAIMDNRISERHARSLLMIKEPENQVKWLNRIIENRLTVRQLDEQLKNEYEGGNMNSTFNIEQMKQNAVDINSNYNMTSMNPPTDAFSMGPIDLGQKTSNKFFNNLEDQAANMQMTEAINPFNKSYTELPSVDSYNEFTVASTPSSSDFSQQEPVIPNFMIDSSKSAEDSLDVLDFEPSTVGVDLTVAKSKIENLILDLKNNNFNVELQEKIEGNQTVYSIVIKNTPEN